MEEAQPAEEAPYVDNCRSPARTGRSHLARRLPFGTPRTCRRWRHRRPRRRLAHRDGGRRTIRANPVGASERRSRGLGRRGGHGVVWPVGAGNRRASPRLPGGRGRCRRQRLGARGHRPCPRGAVVGGVGQRDGAGRYSSASPPDTGVHLEVFGEDAETAPADGTFRLDEGESKERST